MRIRKRRFSNEWRTLGATAHHGGGGVKRNTVNEVDSEEDAFTGVYCSCIINHVGSGFKVQESRPAPPRYRSMRTPRYGSMRTSRYGSIRKGLRAKLPGTCVPNHTHSLSRTLSVSLS